MKLNLRLRTYIVLCILACVTPFALDFVQFASGSWPSGDILFAALGNLAASILTYPAGVVGTIAFYALVYVGLQTPTEAVLSAAPLYIGAGYFQWYVLIPKHFRAGANSALDLNAPPSDGASREPSGGQA